MADSAIRIQCLKCRNDLAYIDEEGEVEEDKGNITIVRGSLSIFCHTCGFTVTKNIDIHGRR